MTNTLLTAGLVCIIAAIIGGGLKAFGIEIPALQSTTRQILLGALGLILLLGAFRPAPDTPSQVVPRPDEVPVATQTPSAPEPQGQASASEIGGDDSGGEEPVFRTVHFDSDSSSIRDVDKPVLNDVAETLRAQPNVRIAVNGYADVVGEYNRSRSDEEASTVAEYLEAHGVSANRIVVQGFGNHFVATNQTAEGRAENRRVELVPID